MEKNQTPVTPEKKEDNHKKLIAFLAIIAFIAIGISIVAGYKVIENDDQTAANTKAITDLDAQVKTFVGDVDKLYSNDSILNKLIADVQENQDSVMAKMNRVDSVLTAFNNEWKTNNQTLKTLKTELRGLKQLVLDQQKSLLGQEQTQQKIADQQDKMSVQQDSFMKVVPMTYQQQPPIDTTTQKKPRKIVPGIFGKSERRKTVQAKEETEPKPNPTP